MTSGNMWRYVGSGEIDVSFFFTITEVDTKFPLKVKPNQLMSLKVATSHPLVHRRRESRSCFFQYRKVLISILNPVFKRVHQYR